MLVGVDHSAAAEPLDPARKPVAFQIDEDSVRAAAIVTERIARGELEAGLTLPGVVAIPQRQLRAVSAPAEGLIEEIFVANDEAVRQGQPLARLRSPEVIAAQRQFLTAVDDLRLAEDRLRRAQSLIESRAIPEREFREAQNAATQARARLDERTYILSLMELSPDEIEALRQTRRLVSTVTIHSPNTGAVVARHTSAGERVDTAAPLFTIADLNPLWVNIQVPAARLAGIGEGTRVTLPAQGIAGRVLRIGRSIDPATQSAQVVAEIETNGGSVRPGLAVSASIQLAYGGDASWLVPAGAVVRHRDRNWVFVRTPSGFEARPVDVIAGDVRRASIHGHFAEGDQVATRGTLALLALLAETGAK